MKIINDIEDYKQWCTIYLGKRKKGFPLYLRKFFLPLLSLVQE